MTRALTQTQLMNCFGHHFQLLGSNIRGKRVSKVEQNPLATKLFLSDNLVLCTHKREWTSDDRTFDSCVRTTSTAANAACYTCRSRKEVRNPLRSNEKNLYICTFRNSSPFVVVMKKPDESSKSKHKCWLQQHPIVFLLREERCKIIQKQVKATKKF